MNKKAVFGLVILLSITSCVSSQTTPTKVVNSPVATETLTPQPTYILVATSVLANLISPLVSESSLQPGIYPVFYSSTYDKNFAENISSGKPQSFANIGDYYSVLSPDGHSVIYMDYDHLWDYNFVTGDKRKVPQPDLNDGKLEWDGSWSPDGKYVAYSIYPKEILFTYTSDDMDSWGYYIADLENNQFIKIADWVLLTNHPPLWSPDGKWIALLSTPKNYSPLDSDTDLYLFDTSCLHQFETCQQDSVKRLTDTLSTGSIWEMSWSPDSKKIATLYASNTQKDDIYTVDLQGHMINLTNTPNTYKDAVSWSPRGDELAFRSGNANMELQLLSLENGSLTTINAAPDNYIVGEPNWSPDGNYIAYSDQGYNDNHQSVKVYSISQKKNITISVGGRDDYEFRTWLSILPPFQVGTVLKVSPYGNNLNLHDQPSLSSTVLSKLPTDQVLTIIDGPAQADDYTWWQVKAGDLTGWVAQVPLWYLANNPLVIDGQ